ncbi:hypothetical protein AVBRAN12640_03635 [Campylobacter sp. RM12640]|uniref:hypothetical protein n=1 Tax=unclassified Campylobacter TaxID=2593542 RepID=UPI0030148E55|nr:hypothetical protein [Campylobacter sp. RM12640]MBZ7988504.1 hypothetical protein [Campylobacter sp. RM12635]
MSKKINIIMASTLYFISTGCVMPELLNVNNVINHNNNSNTNTAKIIRTYPDKTIVTQGNMNYGKKCAFKTDPRNNKVVEVGYVIQDACLPDWCKKWYDNVDLEPKSDSDKFQVDTCHSFIIYNASLGYKLIED